MILSTRPRVFNILQFKMRKKDRFRLFEELNFKCTEGGHDLFYNDKWQ